MEEKILVTQVIEKIKSVAIATPSELPQTNVFKLFEKQAEKCPDKIALVLASEQFKVETNYTYSQLNNRANQIARTLSDRGIVQGDSVGILLENGFNLLTCLLGVLKAGAIYVPIDHTFPLNRISYVLEDSHSKIVVCESATRNITNSEQAEKLDIDLNMDSITSQLSENRPCEYYPEQLAYIMYTSGTTGHPKGVEISHRSLINFLISMEVRPGYTKHDRFLSFTSPSFDISLLELLGPLICGGTVVFATRYEAADAEKLKNIVENHKITIMQATPTTWMMLLESGWKGSNQLKALCGGEALPLNTATQLANNCLELWNMYGPTETTIWSSCVQIKSNISKVSIGRPIANTQLYVLDEEKNIVLPETIGELFIGGEGLASGYINRTELYNEKFIKSPFTNGKRLYQTGDMARWVYDSTGNLFLECLGRTDSQLKIRGIRIESGEIESHLKLLVGIKDAVVVVREEHVGDQRLVAFVIMDDAKNLEDINFLESLREKLPSYMVPSRLIKLDNFPVTHNNKLDRESLKDLVLSAKVNLTSAYSLDEGLNETELILLGIWQDIINIDTIKKDDNFFELGGHSLLAVELFVKVNAEFKLHLPISILFLHSTIRLLSKKILQEMNLEKITDKESIDAPWDTTVVMNIGPSYSDNTVFLVGGVGGNVNNLYQLSDMLGKKYRVIGLQSRGILNHQPHETIEEMATDHIQYIRKHQENGPYIILGYSGGAYVAFEIARQLEMIKESIQFLGLLDKSAPNFSCNPRTLKNWIFKSFWYYGFSYLQQVNLLFKKLKNRIIINNSYNKDKSSSEFQRFLRLTEGWLNIAKNYKGGIYSGNITIFFSPSQNYKECIEIEFDKTLGWQDMNKKKVNIVNLDCGHLDMLIGKDVANLSKLLVPLMSE